MNQSIDMVNLSLQPEPQSQTPLISSPSFGEATLQPDRPTQLLPQRSYNELDHMHEPEETPHGRHIGVYGVVMMIIHRIIGSGIFSVSSMIYKDVGGSPFLFFLVWIISGYTSFAGLFCFMELGCIIPRSGGMKVFLEYIYYKPKMMIAVIFNIYSVLFGFIITNAIIFGEYLLYAIGYDNFEARTAKFTGFLFIFLVCIIHSISTRFGVKLQNFIGLLKLALMLLMSLTGLYVLLLPESVTHIKNNFRFEDFFKFKTSMTLSSLTSALLKGIFSLNGWQTAHIVTNEIKDPIRTMKIAGPLALFLINVAYFLINFSYLVVIPSNELLNIDEMVGSVLFEKIFGSTIGRRILTSSIAISAAGNIIAVLFHISRMNQETFREGFLPFSEFFASNFPFGAPMPALIFPFLISSCFLLIPTPGNVYNYAINLEGYPLQLFIGLTCFGIILIRRRRPELDPPIKASMFDIMFMTLFSIFMFIGPLNPFKKDDEFQGLPNYAYLSLLILFGCFMYWFIMFYYLPTRNGYQLIQKEVTLSDGLIVKKWKKETITEIES